jgi:YceI-like domain
MRIIITTIFTFLFANNITAQSKLFTKTGSISFFSKTNVENISAKNNKVLSVWEMATGNIEFSVLMKGFEFEKALMQEHFNENYVESDKFPKATFKGIIENSKTVSLVTNNSYTLKVTGTLTMHGVTKPVTTSTTIKINNGIASATASFNVLMADYNIKIPAAVSGSINKSIQISINIPAYAVLGK